MEWFRLLTFRWLKFAQREPGMVLLQQREQILSCKSTISNKLEKVEEVISASPFHCIL